MVVNRPVDVRIIRISNTFGPFMRIDDGRVANNFFRAALDQVAYALNLTKTPGEGIPVHGEGFQDRTFSYIEDQLRSMRFLSDPDTKFRGSTIADRTLNSGGDTPSAQLDMNQLANSMPTEETLPTFVRKGATIGANATIGCGLEIGECAMVGMGSVVTRSVPSFYLVYGNPARHRGYVCQCGVSLGDENAFLKKNQNFRLSCKRCQKSYLKRDGQIIRG